jgi:polyadenylate-binding protein
MSQQQIIYPNVSLYVGDLLPEVSEGILYEIFNTVGDLQLIKVCRDDVTKRSLGYAYVNFINPQDAERALLSLNHTLIKGRPCRIMWQQRNPSRRRQGKGNIYISNLHVSINNKDLYDAFSQFGTISSCKVVLDEKNQESKGYGYVHFEKEEDAQKAIELVNGKDIRGKVVYAAYFIPRGERLKARENSWTNVFFRNLPSHFTKDEAERLFARYGEVTSTFVKQKLFADETKIFGFANFKRHEDAVTACDELNDMDIEGNVIYCSRAQSRSERDQFLRKQKDVKMRDMYSEYAGRNLYIKYIEDSMSEDELRNIFSAYGNITSAKIMVDENGNRKGFGFVCFETKEQARIAVDEMGKTKSLHGYSKPLYVAFHEPKDVRRVKYAQRYSRRQNVNYPGITWGNQQMPPYGTGYPPQQNVSLYPGRPQQAGQVPNRNQQPVPKQNLQQQIAGQPAMQPYDLPPREAVLSMGINERRDILGRYLFYIIDNIKPGGYASKITGMLLEWDVNQIYDLLGNHEMMLAAVSQAVELINKTNDMN